MRQSTFSLSRADGHAIFTRLWRPDAASRAVVQIVHGLAEHSARYRRLAEALTRHGYAVYAHDHRGHGPNCPPADLGFFAERDGWRKLLDDTEAVAERIAANHPGLPRAFLGHSMGSFLGQTYIAEHGDALAAAVLSGSSGPPPAILAVGRRLVAFERWRLGPRGKSPLVQALLFGAQNKPFRPARTPYDWLSRDAAEVDKYIADPLCGFALTNQLAADLVGALADLASPALAARIPKTLPIYVFSGARDPVGAKLQGLLDVYRAAGLDVTAKIYPDARHETLNEINRDEVTRDLISWLDARL
ncbi:MAG TPA: alpha/beta hydrolase [Roseiarcus sp.]|nr:alpha/beta hydrolase [Roseiarcus sp.]